MYTARVCHCFFPDTKQNDLSYLRSWVSAENVHLTATFLCHVVASNLSRLYQWRWRSHDFWLRLEASEKFLHFCAFHPWCIFSRGNSGHSTASEPMASATPIGTYNYMKRTCRVRNFFAFSFDMISVDGVRGQLSAAVASHCHLLSLRG